MNCKAQCNLRSLQNSKQDVHSRSWAAAFPPARGSCCNARILTNISCNSFLDNQKMGRCMTPKGWKEVVAGHRLLNAIALGFSRSLKSVEEAS